MKKGKGELRRLPLQHRRAQGRQVRGQRQPRGHRPARRRQHRSQELEGRLPVPAPGQCGRVVAASRRRWRRWATSPRSGPASTARPAARCSPTAKSTDMSRNVARRHAWSPRVFAGRGDYDVRHPDAGEHAEVPLSKQVLVFAKGDKALGLPGLDRQAVDADRHRALHFHQRPNPATTPRACTTRSTCYDGYAVHGYESVPNYAASHGCVRTFIADQPRSSTGSITAKASSSSEPAG